MLSRNRRREAPHAGISEYECMIRRLMDIEECWKLFESTQDCAAREGQRERERERRRDKEMVRERERKRYRQ
jgi:hypothetical protein